MSTRTRRGGRPRRRSRLVDHRPRRRSDPHAENDPNGRQSRHRRAWTDLGHLDVALVYGASPELPRVYGIDRPRGSATTAPTGPTEIVTDTEQLWLANLAEPPTPLDDPVDPRRHLQLAAGTLASADEIGRRGWTTTTIGLAPRTHRRRDRRPNRRASPNRRRPWPARRGPRGTLQPSRAPLGSHRRRRARRALRPCHDRRTHPRRSHNRYPHPFRHRRNQHHPTCAHRLHHRRTRRPRRAPARSAPISCSLPATSTTAAALPPPRRPTRRHHRRRSTRGHHRRLDRRRPEPLPASPATQSNEAITMDASPAPAAPRRLPTSAACCGRSQPTGVPVASPDRRLSSCRSTPPQPPTGSPFKPPPTRTAIRPASASATRDYASIPLRPHDWHGEWTIRRTIKPAMSPKGRTASGWESQ